MDRSTAEQPSPAMEVYLLGRIDYERCLRLQQQLVEQIAGRWDGQITLLLCEHPSVVTVGRGGSPAQIATDRQLLRTRQIEVRWVNRGGGCLVHCPGQLAIYPLVPLQWHGYSVGEFLQRVEVGIVETLDDLGIHGRTLPGRHGIWGRTGQLVALGAAVRHWVTYHGAFLNVSPPMGLFRLVESDPLGETHMSSLVAERCGPVKMTTVRATLVRHLAEALGCDRYHLYTGHPWLRRGLNLDASNR
jgi:lipoyl(octanoyl) transferase